MGGITLESLRTDQQRQSELSSEAMTVQTEAVKNMVTAAHDQLMAHLIDRDAKTNRPVSFRRYDSFFKIQDADAVMTISSVGLPSEESRHGLFVYIYSKDQDEVNQIVGLQTAKIPSSVGEGEALWLSGYSPDQLELLASIITEAESTDEAVYQEYVNQSQLDSQARLRGAFSGDPWAHNETATIDN